MVETWTVVIYDMKQHVLTRGRTISNGSHSKGMEGIGPVGERLRQCLVKCCVYHPCSRVATPFITSRSVGKIPSSPPTCLFRLSFHLYSPVIQSKVII